MKEGKPIWVQSLLSDEEYRECARKYPEVFGNDNKAPAMFDCDFKWRYGMGDPLSPQEIKIINDRLAFVLKRAGLTQN